LAIVLGGPTLDKLAALAGALPIPPTMKCWAAFTDIRRNW